MRNKVLSNDELFNNFPNDLNFLNNEEMNIDDVLSDIKKLNDFYYNYLIWLVFFIKVRTIYEIILNFFIFEHLFSINFIV